MNGEPRGLYNKYIVQRADGTPTDSNAQYFVLRLDTDHWARQAARYYARLVSNENVLLADGITELVHDIEYLLRCDACKEEP